MKKYVFRTAAVAALTVVAATVLITVPGGSRQAAAQGDAPLPPVVVSETFNTVPDVLPWGVVDIVGGAYYSTNLRIPVFALQQIGDTMYVGGMFESVQEGENGTPIAQNFLAAFDVNTGVWDNTFTPSLDGSVYALAATPDGTLIVGGEFTNIDGQPNTEALAAIDPATGAVDDTWVASLERPWSSLRPVVRALTVSGDDLYAAGNFSHHNGPFGTRTRVYKAIKVDASNGELDQAYDPVVTGSGAWAQAVSPDGSEVYLGGYFSDVNLDPDTEWIAVVDGANGDTIPGLDYIPAHSSTAHVQAIDADAEKLWYSGSQHYIFQHDRGTWDREEGTTYVWGGDGQAIVTFNDVIYNACHCFQSAWTDSYTWPTPSPGAVEHDINWISAHRRADFSYIDAWQPEIYMENGDGPWALTVDDNACLWAGGDIDQVGLSTPSWAGGFARMCSDWETPSTPASLFGNWWGSTAVLQWTPSTDNVGVDHYEVFRDGVSVGTTTSTTYFDTGATDGSTYRVRAIDAVGNSSATSDSIVMATPDGVAEIPIELRGTWSYNDDGADPGGWVSPAFDDGAWDTGDGSFGFGDGDETTVVSGGATSYQFRNDFSLSDPDSVDAFMISYERDDAVALYINGREVHREHLPATTVDYLTRATDWVWGADESALVTVVVPAPDNLSASGNVVAASVHNGSPTNGDLSFDLELVPLHTGSDTSAPTQPSVDAIAGAGGATLTWTASNDDIAVAGYRIVRDGAVIGTVDSSTTTFDDLDYELGDSATYDVAAFDPSGNVGQAGSITIGDNGNGEVLLPFGSTWSYVDDGSDQGTAWREPGFDDGAWSTGPSEAGFGDGDEATTVTAGNVTYYFRSTFIVDNPAQVNSLLVDLVRDDGAIVYVNGVEIARDNMPPGEVAFDTTASTWVGGAEEANPVSSIVDANMLVAGVNTVAVEVHNVWSGNADLSFDLQLTAETTPPPADEFETLIEAGENWTYLDDGSDQGTAWRAPAFDDLLWATGAAPLGYGDGDEATVINEGPVPNRHITYYFRHEFNVVDPDDFADLEFLVQRDDGVIVYINDVEVIRDVMPAGPIDAFTLASDYVFGANESDYHEFTVPTDALVAGSNVVAVEIHSADQGSKDISFDLQLRGRNQ